MRTIKVNMVINLPEIMKPAYPGITPGVPPARPSVDHIRQWMAGQRDLVAKARLVRRGTR